MYSKTIMERFQNPRNVGIVRGANAVGQVRGDAGADLMKLYLQIDKMKIVEAKFKAFGCAVAFSTLDVMCDLVTNKSVDDALQISERDVSKILGEIPDYKKGCMALTEEVVKVAIQDYFKRQEKEARKALKKAR